jgi:hypothetical protein
VVSGAKADWTIRHDVMASPWIFLRFRAERTGGWGMKAVETAPLGGRVKVDISLYKSVTPVKNYVLYQFSMQDFPIINHSKVESKI